MRPAAVSASWPMERSRKGIIRSPGTHATSGVHERARVCISSARAMARRRERSASSSRTESRHRFRPRQACAKSSRPTNFPLNPRPALLYTAAAKACDSRLSEFGSLVPVKEEGPHGEDDDEDAGRGPHRDEVRSHEEDGHGDPRGARHAGGPPGQERLRVPGRRQARGREPQGPHGPQPADGRGHQDPGQARAQVPHREGDEGRRAEVVVPPHRIFGPCRLARRGPRLFRGVAYARSMTPPAPAPGEPRVHGEAIVYRLFDVGYAIALDRALDLLASSAPERLLPSRGKAQTIQIPNPPVTASLGVETLVIGARPVEVELSARVFDFGVVSLRARVSAHPGLGWNAFAAWGAAVGDAAWTDLFATARDRLLTRIASAIEQPVISPFTEDYTVFRVHQLVDGEGAPFPPASLDDGDIARLLLGEQRPLAEPARAALLSPRHAYFEDDLVVLTWATALVIEPVRADTDVQYVL